MNPDIERVQHYLAIGQKVSAPEKQSEKRKPRKRQQYPSEESLFTEEEQAVRSESETALHSEEHLDITT